ncbi:MAG: RNA polymerase sigma factor, partial [Burkholderiales bacterium]
FVQFVLDHRDLGAIGNLESYLYGMLKNTQLSYVRRAAHDPHRHLALVEYDSAELGWRALDPMGRLQAQSELQLICRYACARSRTSKAGSVLLLRFFHGYYPSEIALILQTTIAAVARWLQIARAEAKLCVADPQALGFISEPGARQMAITRPRGEADLRPSLGQAQPPDFIKDLVAAIFNARSGECLTREQLRQLYRTAGGGEITGATLGHFVTCPVCLDEINRLLNLPLLAARHPQDTIDRDERRKDDDGRGPGGSGFSGRRAIKAAAERGRRRFRETFEHRPKELRVAANGYVLGAHKISSEVSELELTLNLAEAIDFIEVFSEQRLRLILLD